MVGSKRCSLYYELLEQDQTIKEIYQQQLIRLSDATEKKWPFIGSYKIILLYDNAKPHTTEIMKEIIFSLSWEILHAVY